MRRLLLLPLLLTLACAAEVPSEVAVDEAAATSSCAFAAGARPRTTLTAAPRTLPIRHVIVVTQENRSFDHMLGALALEGRDVDGVPASFVNVDTRGRTVGFHHRTDTCLDADSPHSEDAIEASVAAGRMDAFVKSAATSKSDGHYVMGYYTRAELPFYYFLADRFAISDRYFAAMPGPTDPNRDFLYAATSNGVTATGKPMKGVRTIYDALDDAGVSWGVYSSAAPRQSALGWTRSHRGVHGEGAFFEGLEDGTLPSVTFVDPGLREDEHPPHDVQAGEAFARRIYDAVTKSPLWGETVVFFTYDEAGGLADHVPPPRACAPSAALASFDRLGPRVPVTVVSPFAKRGFVSHATHSHTSILRFVELVWDLPALTARDANADAMLDLFDFAQPVAAAPVAPSAGHGGCVDDPSRNAFTDVVQDVGNWWDRLIH